MRHLGFVILVILICRLGIAQNPITAGQLPRVLDPRYVPTINSTTSALPIVANRNNSLYAGQNLDAYCEQTYRTFHTAAVNCADIQLTFSNFFESSSTDTLGTCSIVVSCSIEPTIGTTPILCYFGGSRSVTIAPGGTVTSNPIPIAFVAGTQFAIRTRVQHLSTDVFLAGMTGTPVTGTGTLAAGTYWYRISQIVNGVETGFGFDSNCTYDHSYQLSATGQIVLNWSQSANATGYRIYRGSASTTETLLASIGNGVTLTYTDDGSVTPSGAQPNFGWPTGLATNSSLGEGKNNGYPFGRDYTTGAFSIPSNNSVAYSPTAIRGRVMGTTRPRSMAWIGDSIAYGSLDSTSSPYGNDQNGYLYRVFTGHVGTLNLTKGGTTALTQALYSNHWGRYLELRGITDVICEFGTNDLGGSGRTATQLEADLQTIYAELKAHGIRVFQATLLPRGDYNFSQEGYRVAVNTWIRSNVASIDGYIEVANVLEVGQNTSVQLDGNFNLDLVHPNAVGHAAIAAARGLVKVSGSSYDWSYFYPN